MHVEQEFLTWDSDFFGFRVERIRVPAQCDGSLAPMSDVIARSSARLTYVSVPAILERRDEIARMLLACGGVHYGSRVTLRKTIAPSRPDVRNLASPAIATRLTEALFELAYASGHCSRFARDPMLASSFRMMYRKWLERDFAAGRVFVSPGEEAPEGMATVSVRDGTGKIGLVAVRTDCRRKGHGTNLMRMVDAWLSSQGVGVCEVVTQGENAAALSLYRATGFESVSKEEIWHVWKEAR